MPSRVLTRSPRRQLVGLRATGQVDQVAHVHTAGLTPQRDLDVSLRDEHAQTIRVAPECHRRVECERFAIDAGVRRARAGAVLDALAAELAANTPRRPVSSRRRWEPDTLALVSSGGPQIMSNLARGLLQEEQEVGRAGSAPTQNHSSARRALGRRVPAVPGRQVILGADRHRYATPGSNDCRASGGEPFRSDEGGRRQPLTALIRGGQRIEEGPNSSQLHR
jgi:hypothetical protein